MGKRWWIGAAIGALLAALVVSALVEQTDGGGSAERHDPILFVHGWNATGSAWDTMIRRFSGDGWTSAELNAWTYDTSRSNRTTAEDIETKVEEILAATGADTVDIVTHSMGALPSRWYAKLLGGHATIDAWVSLAGPNHGTDAVEGCRETSCREMRVGSAFLSRLNAGDETPGDARYGTWWSPCDTVINPDTSVPLSGAANTKTACISHNALVTDATVYGQVRDFVR